MRNAVAILIACLAAGCVTQHPSELERRCRATIIPGVEFRQTNPVDALDFVFVGAKGIDAGGLTRRSIMSPAEREAQQSAYNAKYARLTEFCGPRRITGSLRNCSLLDLLDFVTRNIGASYAFEDEAIVIKSPNGGVLVRE